MARTARRGRTYAKPSSTRWTRSLDDRAAPAYPASRRRNVQRVDHHHFHGWHVVLKRAGRRYERYFRDRGDRNAALGRALAWRDQMAARLPPPRKFKRTFSLNTTGVVGVHLARGRTRKGTRVRYYCATWVEATGQPRKRSFSVSKYGAEKAFDLAVRARREALADALRPRGSRLRRVKTSRPS